MRYVGVYGEGAVKDCLEVALNFIKSNDYYSRQNFGWGSRKAGCNINREFMYRKCDQTRGWGDYYIPSYGWVESLKDFNPDPQWFYEKTVGWRTCNGNELFIYFYPKLEKVEITADGRRHGIPSVSLLQKIDPYLEWVKEYVTWRPEWKPWENLHMRDGEINKLMLELRQEMALSDIPEMTKVITNILKEYGFKKIGEVSFNDDESSPQIERIGFYHEGEDVTAVIETMIEYVLQEYYPQLRDEAAHYEPEYIVRVRFYRGEIKDLGFCGEHKILDVIEERGRKNE